MPITAEGLWKTWRDNFGPWSTTHYGEELWKQEFRDDELTQGVWIPFTLTKLAPELGCRVRFFMKNMDAVLLNEDGTEHLAHIEYETDLNEIMGEIPKLARSKAPTKCVVSYYTRSQSKAKNVAHVREFLEFSLEPAAYSVINKNPSQVWVMICTVGETFSQRDDMVAFKFEMKDGKPNTVPLE